MAVEVALVALVGSASSLVGAGERESKSKIVRRGVSGWGLAFFGGQDLAGLIAHLFTFEPSVGVCVFFTGYVGAAFLDRVITLINALSFKGSWIKNGNG